MIVIVDYGMGNMGSIQNMLKKVGAESIVSSDHAAIRDADKLILPGVGAFDNGMKQIRERDLIPVLNEKVLVQKTPLLGICLGMQLLTGRSEEGESQGLGWLDAKTLKFDFSDDRDKLRIPHMGWNTIVVKKESPLFRNLEHECRFYFVHSYYVRCTNKDIVVAEARYGVDIVASVQQENIFGTQFHPEKSHKFGMQILKNFVELC